MAAPRVPRKGDPLDDHGLDEYKAMLDKNTIMWKVGSLPTRVPSWQR